MHCPIRSLFANLCFLCINTWNKVCLKIYTLTMCTTNWLTDLVPWRCSCGGTQRQLSYGSSPGVSVLGKMNRVVYSQAHVSTVAPDYIEPSFLWSPSSSLAVYIPLQCQLWMAILSHSAHVAKVSKLSLLNPTVDILAQLQSVEDVFVSDVVPSCHSLNLSQIRHLKDLESVLLCRL